MSTAAPLRGKAFRAEVLRRHGAGPAETAELLAYTAVELRRPPRPPALPLADEPFAAAWAGYAAEAAERGAWPVLRARLPQLAFPVAEGVSRSDAYQASLRRGEPPPDGPGVELARPEALRLFVHPTPAGGLPVLAAGCREDFVTLVRALARHGEPSPVPPSMGALMVAGFNNWDRVAALRRAWEAGHPGDAGGWRAAWREMMPRRELYQDRFVILAPGPYSGVAAGEVGMDAEAWDRVSLAVRLEHEAAHYFSRRVLGAMRPHALDEIVADFAGITAAVGQYRADWALRFLGLEAHPAFRPGGRLANYRGTRPLGDAAFAVLRSLAHAAVAALAEFDAARRAADASPAGRGATLAALFALPLEALAAPDALRRLRRSRARPWARGRKSAPAAHF